jgi:hypothetical protein
MSHPYYPSGNPRLNHVAMSLDAGLLDATHRAALCDFWGEVFGFEELDVMTEDRHRLVLSCVHWDQFLFLIAEDEPMRCPRMDHFGFAVGTRDELQGVRDRAVAYAGHDDRVDLVDLAVDDQGVVKIHSFYVRFLLPMMAEVQWWEFTT